MSLLAMAALCLCTKESPTNTGITNHNFSETSVSDVDSNHYSVIAIGTQLWMKESLRTTRYNDGSVIPYVADNAAWTGLGAPAYCWYGNDSSAYKTVYGALYNWYAVNSGKLAPAGWHVASDSEWNVLITFLGADSLAGGKLKDTGITFWNSPNVGATNETGFSGLPAGYRAYDGSFSCLGTYGYWWTSSANGAGVAWYRYFGYNFAEVGHSYTDARNGFCVRCIKD